MALPFILAGAAIIAGGYGIKKGIDAKNDLDDAEHYQNLAKAEAAAINNNLETQKNKTNTSLEVYGSSKKKGFENIHSFNSFICYPDGERRSNGIKVGKKFEACHPKIIITHEEEAEILKELHIIDESLSYDTAQQTIKAKNIEMETFSTALASIAGGSLAGLAAGGGAYLGVGSLATASTGTAISGLYGAAATKATLAWLGGGSLASGGFGVAGGTVVLGGLVAGPLLAIGGAILAANASEKKDEAMEILSRIRTEVKKLEVVISKLVAIERYTQECNTTFNNINNYFGNTLLKGIEHIAQRNPTLKELSQQERAILFASYELNYLIFDFINEPTMNTTGDDVLPLEKRAALSRIKNLQYISKDDFKNS